ncbi:MAG: HAD-IC family P-type ATPase, partial [Clostridia bacterium]|nr:HAD-IC family P-type ATPase [Clostridia bacterium]
MKYYLSPVGDVMRELQTRGHGLSDEEAGKRLEKYGKNKLAEGKHDGVVKRFFKQLLDPMIIILLVAAVLSGITAAYSGESMLDVFIILFIVVLNSVLGVIQESKAEKAIEALKEMTAATSKVVRGGELVHIKSEDLVPGDIIHLEAGDAVPADVRIIECASLKLDESALTGESVAVMKQSDAIVSDGPVALGDRCNMAYMGSTVVYGRGVAVVTETGMNTEMGHIAGAL